MDNVTTTTLVRNDTTKPVTIQRNAVVSFAIPADLQEICYAAPAEHPLAFMPEPREALKQEVKMTNGVTVYGTPAQTNALSRVVMQHPDLFTDRGFVKLPEDRWMRIPLKPG